MIVRHDIQDEIIEKDRIKGIIEINDPNFGNLWTNITKKSFENFGFKHGDKIKTIIYHNDDKVFENELYYYESFGMAEDHSVMIYNNEVNKIALAEVVGNLDKDYNLSYGPEYRIEFVR